MKTCFSLWSDGLMSATKDLVACRGSERSHLLLEVVAMCVEEVNSPCTPCLASDPKILTLVDARS